MIPANSVKFIQFLGPEGATLPETVQFTSGMKLEGAVLAPQASVGLTENDRSF